MGRAAMAGGAWAVVVVSHTLLLLGQRVGLDAIQQALGGSARQHFLGRLGHLRLRLQRGKQRGLERKSK